jgi:hypothetical protein
MQRTLCSGREDEMMERVQRRTKRSKMFSSRFSGAKGIFFRGGPHKLCGLGLHTLCHKYLSSTPNNTSTTASDRIYASDEPYFQKGWGQVGLAGNLDHMAFNFCLWPTTGVPTRCDAISLSVYAVLNTCDARVQTPPRQIIFYQFLVNVRQFVRAL